LAPADFAAAALKIEKAEMRIDRFDIEDSEMKTTFEVNQSIDSPFD